MRRWLPVLLLVAACGGGPPATVKDTATPAPTLTPRPTTRATPAATLTPTHTPSPKARPSHRPTKQADPRWRFYSQDRSRHTSPWFAGDRRVMIGYGCNASPWYDHDPRCPGKQGFHHGIDVAMPCGTPLFSAVDGVVLDPSTSGSPGPAYGVNPFRIRTSSYDILIGHTRRVFVHPGDKVHPGQRIGLASDSGAPDGCHLHFEVRTHGGGVSDATDPAPLLHLSPA